MGISLGYVDLKEVELQKCAKIAMETCLGVQPGENVLVVGDTSQSQRMAVALCAAAYAAGATPTWVVYPAGQVHSGEPPKSVAAAMAAADAVMAFTTKSLTHTDATRKARVGGTRVMTCPGITEEMFLRTTPVDYEELSDRIWRIFKMLTTAKTLELTSKAGTHVTAKLGYWPSEPIDGYCHKPGDWDQIPSGVFGLAPIEGTTNGILVAEGGKASIESVFTDDVTIEIKDGMITAISGGKEAAALQRTLEEIGDKNMMNIAEFGSGSNPNARFVGSFTEDERIIGSVHVGLGDNARTLGGKVHARGHLDITVLGHSLMLDGKPMIIEGALVI